MNRKTLALCLTLACAPAFAFSGNQGPDGAGMRRGAPMEFLTEVLQLRPDQVAQVETILNEQRQAHRDERQRDWEQRKGQRDAQRQQTLAKLSAVLDAEQLARFDGFTQAMETNRRPMRRDCDGRGAPAGR